MLHSFRIWLGVLGYFLIQPVTSCFADKVSVTQAQGSLLPVSTACSSLIFVYALVASQSVPCLISQTNDMTGC